MKKFPENKIKEICESLITERKKNRKVESLLSMPEIIFSENDFKMIYTIMNKPNYITNNITTSEIIELNNEFENTLNLKGKIVLIKNADPGFDWIFTKEINGLITKYGGAASHMAIRCAEFNIPAAIGCGEIIYKKSCEAKSICLNCNESKIEFIQ